MSKKKLFFSIFLLVLSVCFITDVHAEELNSQMQNTLTATVDETTSRWEAIQPERKVTSEGLIIDYNFDNLSVNPWWIEGSVTVTITIPENYELDTIVIAPNVFEDIAHAVYEAVYGADTDNFHLNNAFEPGDKITVNFVINNLSKYTYNYDETSFEIFPTEDIVYDKLTDEGTTTNEDDAPLFNGNTVNENYHFYRPYNTALRALIPNSSNIEMTDEAIDIALKQNGYLNGINDYTEYLLDFYNAKYHTNYTRLDQFPDGIIREILSEKDPFFLPNSAYKAIGINPSTSRIETDYVLGRLETLGYSSPEEYILEYYNNLYGTNATRIVDLPDEALDDFFSTQGTEDGSPYNLETNPDVIALSYDYFYNKGLAWGFEEDEYSHNDSEDLAIGEYMRDETKGDDYIINNAGTLNPNTSDYTLSGTLYTSGPYIMDAYLDYEFNVNLQFTYSALKGTVIAKYVDIYGNVLADDVITKDMVGKDYQTFEKYFDNYVLVTIDGKETGTYIDGEIVVTYVYAPITTDDEPGIGSTTGPIEIIPPKTGIEPQSQNIYFALFLVLSGLGLFKYVSNKE